MHLELFSKKLWHLLARVCVGCIISLCASNTPPLHDKRNQNGSSEDKSSTWPINGLNALSLSHDLYDTLVLGPTSEQSVIHIVKFKLKSITSTTFAGTSV